MTDHLTSIPSAGRPPRPPRAAKGTLRAWAWLAGGVSFLVPSAILGLAPRPQASAGPAGPATSQQPVIIVRHVIRKIIVRAAPRVVTAGGSVSAPTVVTSGGGAAPAPPAGSTGGSHP